ncbi:putative CRISPR-associated protein [Caminibacter mediatlanticus TB-2]|uniref:CRISPR-associated protein n=1 Tax=Caminibacter mediatlanticus TB-2 TaxID=391592 RepID=A0ABX5VBB9_9BACT|nr:putative CRISPR-associated protein [Caminibacter mediatlanticus]QCT95329.1 putative CRISPR-associated protein [Caminibacter mediatlanticus TB-2]
MNYILTTIGLSSLTNGLREVLNTGEIYKYSNMNENDIDKEFKSKFDIEFKKLKENLSSKNNEELKRLSAEINALFHFYKNGFLSKDFHKLLITDTYLGKKSAEIVEEVLKLKGISNISIYSPQDLKTSDIESFHLSLSEIVKDLSEELEGYKSSGYKVIFNLTGGFKSVNSFMQSMASLWADETIYIFESSKELLTIPRLPLKVDEDIFKEKIEVFRYLEDGLNVDENELENIPKSLIIKIGDEYTLSPWGEIVWQKVKRDIFKNLINYKIIEYSNEFKKDFEKLNDNEKFQINKMLDLLDKYKFSGEEKFNLHSLRYHSLSGEIASKYGFEFYPFDGNDSRRAFCNEKDGKVIIEKIDAHLK